MLPAANVHYRGEVEVFLPEYVFFYFLAHNKRLVKPDTRIYRNACELANASCMAVLRVDVQAHH